MTYTRAWNPFTVLLGSRDADEIDDAVRDFASDLDERFKDIMIDPAADPVQLKTKDTKFYVHWSGAQIVTIDPVGILANAGSYCYLNLTATLPGTFAARFPIHLPVGSLLHSVTVTFMNISNTGSIQGLVAKIEKATGTQTTISSFLSVADPAIQHGLDTVEQVIDDGFFYYVEVDMSTGFAPTTDQRLYGITIHADVAWGN